MGNCLIIPKYKNNKTDLNRMEDEIYPATYSDFMTIRKIKNEIQNYDNDNLVIL